MTKILHSLPLIALLGLGTALTAQEAVQTDGADTETQATETEGSETEATESETTETDSAEDGAAGTDEDTAGEAGTDPATGLDLGREAEEPPSYVKETYGDWQLQCFRSEAGEDPCQMYQLLREEGGNPVAEFSLFKLPNEGQAVAGATIAVPLGTLLPQGLKISVDGGKAKNYNYSFCSMGGCFARIGFTQADIDAFQAGAAARLTLIPAQAPDQVVEIEASLSGFTAAYNEVSVLEN
ncbi:Invasion associated locus B (IalB) protein [Roseovarius sp. THAF27]|uniref:invasion associated locus B family protein n=1 Tax=Roseovarius sp. THAF27 TaxID=2587850 RepID=UPI0012A9685B|nr:invasion associated locus B family protein [Roseovarius sp. THAF27]QFT80950.1 Invasion associated locus B (IalB) protein [Roseovarius sp. THAF27]